MKQNTHVISIKNVRTNNVNNENKYSNEKECVYNIFNTKHNVTIKNSLKANNIYDTFHSDNNYIHDTPNETQAVETISG